MQFLAARIQAILKQDDLDDEVKGILQIVLSELSGPTSMNGTTTRRQVELAADIQMRRYQSDTAAMMRSALQLEKRPGARLFARLVRVELERRLRTAEAEALSSTEEDQHCAPETTSNMLSGQELHVPER